MKKKILSLVLTLAMVLSFFPGMTITANAAEGDPEALWVYGTKDNFTPDYTAPDVGSGTLAEAFAAANTTDVIYVQLQKSVERTNGYNLGNNKSMVLDLNGKSITVTTDTGNPYGISAAAGGFLRVANGTINVSSTESNAIMAEVYGILSYRDLTVTDVNINVSSPVIAYGIRQEENSNLAVSGGEISASAQSYAYGIYTDNAYNNMADMAVDGCTIKVTESYYGYGVHVTCATSSFTDCDITVTGVDRNDCESIGIYGEFNHDNDDPYEVQICDGTTITVNDKKGYGFFSKYSDYKYNLLLFGDIAINGSSADIMWNNINDDVNKGLIYAGNYDIQQPSHYTGEDIIMIGFMRTPRENSVVVYWASESLESKFGIVGPLAETHKLTYSGYGELRLMEKGTEPEPEPGQEATWAIVNKGDAAPGEAAYTNSGTLSDAFSAAKDMSADQVIYVKLTGDFTYTDDQVTNINYSGSKKACQRLAANKTMVLDLQGHILTFQIKNTEHQLDDISAIYAQQGSDLTIQNGTITVEQLINKANYTTLCAISTVGNNSDLNNLTLSDCTINVGGSLHQSKTYGIYGERASITVSGGGINVDTTNAQTNYGIYADALCNGKVDLMNTTIDATDTPASSGVYVAHAYDGVGDLYIGGNTSILGKNADISHNHRNSIDSMKVHAKDSAGNPYTGSDQISISTTNAFYPNRALSGGETLVYDAAEEHQEKFSLFNPNPAAAGLKWDEATGSLVVSLSESYEIGLNVDELKNATAGVLFYPAGIYGDVTPDQELWSPNESVELEDNTASAVVYVAPQ